MVMSMAGIGMRDEGMKNWKMYIRSSGIAFAQFRCVFFIDFFKVFFS